MIDTIILLGGVAGAIIAILTLIGNGVGLNKLPEIGENDDFNNYMETSCFAVYRNDTAETIANMPVARAGRLEVWSSTGEGVRAEQWSYLRQRYVPYNESNAVWERDVARGEDNVWHYYEWYRSSLTPALSKKLYDKSAITIASNANLTLSTAGDYANVNFNTVAFSTGSKLTREGNSVRIGENVDFVKVSMQALLKAGSTAGNRHLRIRKNSGGTITNVGWTCIYATTSGNTLYPLTPIVVPVKSGDLIYAMYYTNDTADYFACGSAANGYQTYLTVEEL